MPLRVIQRGDSLQFTALARSKAARECRRPEHDLRILLAHIKILDQLEHGQAPSAPHHGSECERRRPALHKRKSAHVIEEDELNELFDTPASVHVETASSLVTVQELEEDDWD